MVAEKTRTSGSAESVSTPLLEVCTPDAFAITSLAADAGPATVTLLYNPACADLKVTVAPLDGGTLNGSAGGKQIAIGSDGKLTFVYQPPATPGYYNVVVSLGAYQRVLPFQVTAASTTN